MARVIRNLNEYKFGLVAFDRGSANAQKTALRKSRTLADRRMGEAARKAGGNVHRLGRATGYGTRAGSKLGHKFVDNGPFSWTVTATGAWQIVDSSVSGNERTKPHLIKPRPDVNKRPLPPASKYRPSFQFRDGGFGRGTVLHPGSARSAYWRNAIQAIQPKIINNHADAFKKAMDEAYR